MIGDKERCATARVVIEARQLRAKGFSEELFSEFGWTALLHTFVEHVANRTVSASALYEKGAVTPSIGKRWLRHLVAIGDVDDCNEGDDIRLSARAITSMRDYLDNVRTLASAALVVK